ncbi:hypothetical protein JQ594_15610 [Bradyrhizobium manausense]|uniref:hypothetical protein n=1 Tax=Bradyrhizobium manausense TaxID=989370 RepID=UPI001BA6D697|nr:hypothetical protein [Bradyrhizobium manausense]MBR0687358.1 hypothetical protein [Bradyrhizobium manausense]
MTNAPETRKTHVIRILGTNRDGDVLSHMWADVERMDVVKYATQDSDGFWQGQQRQLRWQDDPTADDYSPDGNPARVLDTVKLCNPQGTEDFSDPDEWIPLLIIRSLRSRQGDAGTQDRHRNNPPDTEDILNDARVVETRRIVHAGTSIDADASAAFEADPTLKAFVVPGETYTKDDSTQDDSQYVEHEVITYLKPSGNDEDVSGRNQQIKLLNQYLIDESEPAQLDVTGPNGLNPPYRLDPFQNIVNINFAPNVIVVFVDLNAHPPTPSRFVAIDGVTLLESFSVHVTNPTLSDAIGTAYKVNAAAGAFMTATIPNYPGNEGIPENSHSVHVFAIDGSLSLAANLARVRTGTSLVMAAHYALQGGVDFGAWTAPAQVDPPGLLWSALLATVTIGTVIPWKIRYGRHRADNRSDPRNVMVQCYPTGTPYVNAGGGRTFGFEVVVYRLDPKGTGPVYGVGDNFAGDDNPPKRIDPAWNVPIDDGGGLIPDTGIPFQDPLPLIRTDVVWP